MEFLFNRAIFSGTIALILITGLGRAIAQSPSLDVSSVFERNTENLPGTEFVPHIDWDPLFNLEEYELGPGDVFTIHGAGGKNLSTKLYVTSTYEIFIPAVGSLNVKDMRVKDLKKALLSKLRGRYPGIQLVVVPFKLHDFRVQLRGEVNLPGSKSGNPTIRLHEFLQMSGGLRETASRTNILVENSLKQTKKEIDYQSYLLKGDLKGNPFLEDGDAITVPVQKNLALIKGNIVREGKFEFKEPEVSLKDVVENQLGGFISTQGISGQIVITRLENNQSKTQFVSAEAFFSGENPDGYATFKLKNGDQIYFPTASVRNPGILNNQVFVTGEVKSPLPQPYRPGVSWSAYIAAAGGVTVRANNDQIMIYKASGAIIPVSSNPSIEPGDSIYVPEKTFKFWQDHITILMTFLSLVTTTIAISR